MRAAHAHRVGKLGFELLDVELHALLPAAIDGGNKRAADEHRVRAERQRLEHVHAAADRAVDKNRHLAADGIDDVRKHLRRRGAMVEHTAAVVRDHNAARARLQRLFRAAGGHDAL